MPTYLALLEAALVQAPAKVARGLDELRPGHALACRAIRQGCKARREGVYTVGAVDQHRLVEGLAREGESHDGGRRSDRRTLRALKT